MTGMLAPAPGMLLTLWCAGAALFAAGRICRTQLGESPRQLQRTFSWH